MTEEVTMAAIEGKPEDLVGTAQRDDQRRASTDPQEDKRLQALRASHRSHHVAGVDDGLERRSQASGESMPSAPSVNTDPNRG